ncbi:hypothetical protein CEF21_16655 [Bacillus sp. FJAT-42376]|uniref:SPOR domain-containing protein n=1 Tax=Bacillus sp. FJAT-42376 TaxID=2014076 RepID=UPI000F510694|nr:SPOR domain-containing protein [Bacillus sp. FJAT-42376]AZB43805.1 hypothetical protein CEF21_16655 [Bacillus sp. FJAT-42376]
MDKQIKGRTIKIRMNGESAADEKIIPFSSWEEQAAKESAASAEPEKDEFEWILPDEDGDIFEEDPKVLVKHTEKKKGWSFPAESHKGGQDRLFPIKQFLFTVIVAVVLGISFGFIALNVISNDDMPAAAQPSEGGGEAAGTGTGSVQNGETPPAAANKGASGKMATFVVQNGKFSSRSSADQIADEMKGKGFAAVVREEGGAYFVYGGMGFSKEETASLSKNYQTLQMEAWGGKQTEWKIAESGKAAESLQQAAEKITAASLQAISGGQPDLSKLKTASLDLKEVKEDSRLKANLSSAAALLSSSPSAPNGWKAQQMILDGLKGDK